MAQRETTNGRPEDMALVTAAKNGSGQAFDILFERHKQMIFFVVRRITRTREDAEDVVQRTLQKVFTHLRKFEGRSSFSTWLTRVAINEALMLQRETRRLREVLIDDSNANEETAIAVQIPDSSPDPELSYSQRERERILSSAIHELPHRTRRAIQLRELDERSTKETARIMGISAGAVKARVFHGRRKLRAALKHFVEPARNLKKGELYENAKSRVCFDWDGSVRRPGVGTAGENRLRSRRKLRAIQDLLVGAR
jgi:RNA polymerase sigma-70 factor (ECF subfamily)